MKLVREGGSIQKNDSGYSVDVFYAYEGQFEPLLGFTSARFEIIIPFEIGAGMTVDELYREAFRRIDSVKNML
jgi:hypothetical protein